MHSSDMSSHRSIAALSLSEIRSLDDPLLLPWLDLYETAFPPRERNLESGGRVSDVGGS
jgi:hypothetical protein